MVSAKSAFESAFLVAEAAWMTTMTAAGNAFTVENESAWAEYLAAESGAWVQYQSALSGIVAQQQNALDGLWVALQSQLEAAAGVFSGQEASAWGVYLATLQPGQAAGERLDGVPVFAAAPLPAAPPSPGPRTPTMPISANVPPVPDTPLLPLWTTDVVIPDPVVRLQGAYFDRLVRNSELRQASIPLREAYDLLQTATLDAFVEITTGATAEIRMAAERRFDEYRHEQRVIALQLYELQGEYANNFLEMARLYYELELMLPNHPTLTRNPLPGFLDLPDRYLELIEGAVV
jgi:hypothetical protein